MLHLFLMAVLVSISGSGAHAQTPRQSVPCTRGLVEMPGEGRTGKFVLCSEVEQLVPQLKLQLEQLTAGKAASDGRLQDMERLLRGVNAIAARMDKRQVEIAQSLHRLLSEAAQQSEAGVARRIRRYGDDAEELNEKIVRTAADTRTEEAAAALKPAIEDAVAALDLAKANKLLDSIAAVQEKLGDVERKVDIVVSNTDESRHVAVFAEALRTRAWGDQGQIRALGVFVQQGRTFDGQDLAGVGFAKAQAPGLVAPGADFTLTGFSGANLKAANLTGARMIAAVFEGADLQHAQLAKVRAALVQAQGANLQGANLSRSNWVGADLRGADLRQADLKGANLAHADLRGADLGGADLADAFLRNADLRDAKFEGTKFSNTGVGFALLQGERLNAQQFAALCATAENLNANERWTVIEQIPSSRFRGGYEYRPIFEKMLYIGRGGHRPYPRCQARSKDTLTDWNEPIVRYNNTEYVTDSFEFGVQHPLMEMVGRRAQLLGRLSAATEAALKRPEELPAMHQYAQLRKRLYAELNAREKTLSAGLMPPSKPLPFDPDTATLIALRLRPSILADAGASWKSASEGGFWGYLGAAPDKDHAWPRLFPPEMVRDDLSDVTAKVWERWSKARSRTLRRNEAALQVTSDIFGERYTWGKVLVHQSSASSVDASLAARLGVDSDRLAVFPGRGSLTGIDRLVSTGIVIEGDITLARHTLRAEKTPSNGSLFLPFLIKDVRWIPGAQGVADYVVWTLEYPSK